MSYKLTKQELISAVELAWQVASEAKICEHGMMILDKTTGEYRYNNVRYTTYEHLLQRLVPQVLSGQVDINEPKEKWE